MILVTGATGFLGKRVCRLLEARGRRFERTSLSLGCDLRDTEQARRLFRELQPEKILNCAAFVGGIQYGYQYPAELFRNNMLMTLSLLEVCREFNVRRLVNPISNCAYPARATLFKESEFWDGPLHESVLAYGLARKASWVGAWAYNRQHGLDTINLILSNMFGPEDHFEAARSHALGAMIMKFVEAHERGEKQVVIWGSGKPVREWLYVDDGAEAMIRGLDIPSHAEPINIGMASGLSILELAELIRSKVGYKGEIVLDPAKPDGAPYKTVDGTKGKNLLGWSPAIPLERGIEIAIDWYISHGRK